MSDAEIAKLEAVKKSLAISQTQVNNALLNAKRRKRTTMTKAKPKSRSKCKTTKRMTSKRKK